MESFESEISMNINRNVWIVRSLLFSFLMYLSYLYLPDITFYHNTTGLVFLNNTSFLTFGPHLFFDQLILRL